MTDEKDFRILHDHYEMAVTQLDYWSRQLIALAEKGFVPSEVHPKDTCIACRFYEHAREVAERES